MLDTETKRKIDACRDILVGKVPDPKSQVEQITIALIYKFMDDMDKQSEHWGGKPTFFTGEYERYAWSKIFDPRMGGYDLINTYGEAIVKMNHNPNIPQLFRDIFKNAYLPYRDPETLKAFLKQINDFRYEHSEQLGDAYEYLLSVLSSQGDAGQFRTPRHIIDFIVQIVDPKKNETILDPACGTAGFLISSYRHILQSNKNKVNGDKLTPDDRKRIMNNFFGYDISPDMVRLSLVNMYLHDFPDPKIYEYDTLTSEERWNESADCIMANPPFMTPKGGIIPHKRFSVQAKRSEVLFVDYIAEHLNPHGRAGVIVPEGIIFQSSNAYKQLRKMLVENYLWCVVSLPAGVFQPYSGVKTSILFMDKQLAKKTDKILFVKIENDGYDLGAQRRQIEKNDLPKTLDYIRQYKQAITSGAKQSKTKAPDLAHSVEKEKIAETGDFNLSGERYKQIEQHIYKWPMISLNDVVETITPPIKLQQSEFLKHGTYPIIDQSQNDISGWTENKNAVIKENKPLVIFGDHTCIVKYVENPFVQGADGIKILKTNEKLIPKFLFYFLRCNPVESDGYKRHFSKLKEIKIPLPHLDVQEKIVAEIDGYQKIIDGARQVVENYKPTIKINPDWPMVKLADICSLITKGSSPKWQGINYAEKGILFITSENVGEGQLLINRKKYVEKEFNEIEKKSILKEGDVLSNLVGASIGRTAIYSLKEVANVNQAVCVMRCKLSLVLNLFLMCLLNSDYFRIILLSNKLDNARANLSLDFFRNLTVPLPPLTVQQNIVDEIESEQQAVNANKKLIEIFEQKIKDKIAEVWGETTST